jgi:hypothetical protein
MPDNREWYVERDGAQIAAASLQLLQQQLPNRTIKDYYPDGYTAIRDGFLEQSAAPAT